jgi:hypothetical protein
MFVETHPGRGAGLILSTLPAFALRFKCQKIPARLYIMQFMHNHLPAIARVKTWFALKRGLNEAPVDSFVA